MHLPTWSQTPHGGSLQERGKFSGARAWLLEEPTSGNRTLYYTTQAKEPSFWNPITPNIWPPYSPDCNLLVYYAYDVVEQNTNKTTCTMKDELKLRRTAEFTNLNQDNFENACRRFRRHLEPRLQMSSE